MDVIQAIESRFSVRSYKNDPIDRDNINFVLKAALEAPVSCNLQLVNYLVVDDLELREDLSKVVTAKLLWAPVNIFVFIDNRFSLHRHSGIVGLGAAVENLSLAATSIGLATCPMAGFRGDEYIKDKFSLPSFMEPILIVGLGYPAEKNNKKRERIDFEKIVYFNEYKNNNQHLNSSVNIDDWSVQDIVNYRSRIGHVYRYDDVFRLHSYPTDMYSSAAKIFLDTVKPRMGESVLDLVTYDGAFVKSLDELSNGDIKITASDYVSEVAQKIQSAINDVDFVDINESNKLCEYREYDFVTVVHKLEFTPNYKDLLEDAIRNLKPGGKVFIFFEQLSWYKSLLKALKNFYEIFILKKTLNVYENNTYYKIGPYQKISSVLLKRFFKKKGMNLLDEGTYHTSTKTKLPMSAKYLVFQKSQ